MINSCTNFIISWIWVVTYYLRESGVIPALTQLGFNVVGYGCMTCIGNSGPLEDLIVDAIEKSSKVKYFKINLKPKMKLLLVLLLVVISTIEASWYDGVPFVSQVKSAVQAALGDMKGAERTQQNFIRQAPGVAQITSAVQAHNGDYQGARDTQKQFIDAVEETVDGTPVLGHIKGITHMLLGQNEKGEESLKSASSSSGIVIGAAAGGPVGAIAGRILADNLITEVDIDKSCITFDAAEKYKNNNTPLIALVEKKYGSGSSRDWAAKRPYLLGIRAVIAESYERIHRSHLVGMGIAPLQYLPGQNADTLGLPEFELFDIEIPDNCVPHQQITVYTNSDKKFYVIVRFDTEVDLTYYKNGGILNYMIRSII
ncbi:hypothetical protein HCN44_004664 [Aphidius gifuensis]|uniref:Aconitate hydratase n=1 Tax=Aphidius gifuensis TaxID=684658 RepID=A0A835CTA6_APHGI|nr:hypothetical protein HCN44_004664 [Aphidius gifuensis]